MGNRASLILGVGIMICAGAAVVIAMGWPWKAALFPIVIGIPVFCMAAAEVAWGLLGSGHRGEAMDFQLSEHVPPKIAIRRTLLAIAWMAGFFAAIVLAGFPLAVALVVFLYLKLQGRERWVISIGFTLILWAVFYAIFDRLLHLPFPAGLIQGWTGLG
ncbi:MAG: tripartite tricarboxylate transporter TctB family protein [Betaproteobacteria bacterium]|nr:tripartite tricarboxylate transporter TctB family protein [Betaproteobacteria bacterium]